MTTNNKLLLIGIVLLAIIASSVTYIVYNSRVQDRADSTHSVMDVGGSSMTMSHDMSSEVVDDKTFIENMIPHHQEAVDSSNIILNSTQDADLKTFVSSVIGTQTKEITDMKSWYKNWYGAEYVANSSYKLMMGGMSGKTGTDLDKAYIQGMIMHHKGAISMAQKAKLISKRTEILSLSDAIISSQSKEVAQLMTWMMSKYNDHGMMEM
jgi:uncharacterized protein (DUF305 family)